MNRKIYFLLKFIDYGYKRRKTYIDVNKSTTVIHLCKVLQQWGFIQEFALSGFGDLEKWNLRIFLNRPLLNFNDYKENNIAYLNKLSPLIIERKGFSNFLCFNLKPYRKLVMLSTPTNINYISIINLKKMIKINKKVLLSTNKGYLFDSEAIKYNISGILVCTFYL